MLQSAYNNGNNHSSDLTQSIALEETPIPRAMNTFASLIGIIIAVFLIWSFFAKVEEVATASGQIIPTGYIQNIQHPDGGIVREILIKDGDLVEKGSLLMKLDPTNADADLGQTQARQRALRYEAARLRTYTGSQDNTEIPKEERQILDSMEEARINQQRVLQDQIAQKEKELSVIMATELALQKNLEIKREENELFQESLKRGSSSKLAALSSQRELNALEGQLKETVLQKSRARDAVSEAKSRLQSLNADLKQNAMTKIGTVEAELAEINKSISRQESAAGRTILTSPVRGLVKGLTVHTIGAVLEPGKIIMEIVPIDEELLVEALISPSDIGNIQIGQPVKVKISAFDFARFGHIAGVVESVSASTFQNDKGEFFYKSRIKLEKNYVGKNKDKNIILPGMIVQADIKTGEKTFLQYLLKPVQDATQNAFSER